MIQISTLSFGLLIELIFILLVVLGSWVFITFKRRKNDRAAAASLIEQVRVQSDLRLKETGSYLEQKYQFTGDELSKAIKQIDRAEKKFLQQVITMYLERKAGDLQVMDASLAELIDVYKSLTPAQAVVEVNGESEAAGDNLSNEVETLRTSNEKLTDELAITKQTMANMIAEYANMFGGGKGKDQVSEEVMEVVEAAESASEGEAMPSADSQGVQAQPLSEDEVIAEPDVESAVEVESGPVTEADLAEILSEQSPGKPKPKQDKKKQSSALDFDEGIDELMDGIDLSAE